MKVSESIPAFALRIWTQVEDLMRESYYLSNSFTMLVFVQGIGEDPNFAQLGPDHNLMYKEWSSPFTLLQSVEQESEIK